MKEFGEWFANPERRPRAVEPAASPADPLKEARGALEALLPDDMYVSYFVPCRVCERRYEWPVAPELYDPEHAYCGGSPRCCP